MGWRFRKSINLGLGFRINLSKSGIGYSWGFPGYRITKMSNGGRRTTYSLPGTGISYVEQQGKNSNNKSDVLYLGETEQFKNIPIKEINKSDPILKEINKIALINKLANFLILLTIGCYFNLLFIIGFLLGVGLKIYIYASKKIGLYYNFDDESRKMYNSLKEVLILLSNSKKIWQINSSTKVFNTKYNAGASNNVSRNNAFVTSRMPWFIKTNINVYGLNLKNQKIFFTPDRVLVFKPFGKVFGCTYNDMHIVIRTTNFVESGRVYRDSEIVNYTWQYVNRNGDRDLRFSRNKKYPVCKYGELTIQSPNGINTVIDFSNNMLCDDIQSNLFIFGNQFNKIFENSKNDKKNEDVSTENDFHEDLEQSEKIVIKDISQLIESTNFEEKNTNKISNSIINPNYKLPKINILNNEESKGIIPFIEKMKDDKKVYIPIGMQKEEIVIDELGSMPNMLIGGTVMSGKTAYINTIISSILMLKKPSEVKFIIYDSKKVDYSIYNGIPHLLCPIITDSKKLSIALKKICIEIDNRVDMLRKENLKSISQLNKKLGEKRCCDIIIIIDDFSTLNVNEQINQSIEYITSNGWNVNIYAIISANHPSAKVIPTVSKSNFPARLSFKVASSQASQIIIGEPGAEKLNKLGMALYNSRFNNKIIKLKVPYIADDDIDKIVKHCILEQKAHYDETLTMSDEEMNIGYMTESSVIDEVSADYDEPLYNQIVEFVVTSGKVSASLLQRRFRLGYWRAARAIDILEERGIIGPSNGSKPREVLIKVNKSGE